MKWIQRVPGRTAVRLSKSLARVAPNFCRQKLHNPVFFVGCGRSGTTILSRTLALHPDIAVYPGEANELWHPHLYPWVKATIDAPPFWADPVAFTNASLNQPHRTQHDQYLQAVFGAYQFLHGGRVFLNKSVMVTFMMPHILHLFPDAKFIHLVRDGRAVALSHTQKEQQKIQMADTVYHRKGYTLDFDQLLETFARHWQDHIAEVGRQKAVLNLTSEQLLELLYENMSINFDDEMSRLCDFLEVSYTKLPLTQITRFQNMNHKVDELLSSNQVASLERIIANSLEDKGYIV